VERSVLNKADTILSRIDGGASDVGVIIEADKRTFTAAIPPDLTND
jgi:hypothetical protein